MISVRAHQDINYVSLSDSAVDTDAITEETLKRYYMDFKEERIPIKPGLVPTKFKLRRLTRKQSLRIGVVSGGSLTADQQSEVVAHGLRDVQSWGSPLRFELSPNGERVSDETLNAIYSPTLFHELASVIVSPGMLSPLE